MVVEYLLARAEVVTGQNLAEQATAGHFSPFGDGQGFF